MRNMTLGIALLLVMAACGGDDGDTATTAGSDDETTTTTSGSDNGDGGGNGGSGPGADSDFCMFLDEIEQEQDAILTLTPEALEDAMDRTLDLADQAADIAPSELDNEVDILFTGFEGLVDALADINYDPFTNQAAFIADPRVVYLDSAEYETAGTAVDEYCGDSPDNGTADPPTTVPGTVPSTGGSSGEIPDGYPDDLIPPGVTNVESVGAAPAFSVTFTTDASYDDTVQFFTDAFGPPASDIDAGAGKIAQWVPEAPYAAVIVTEEDGTVRAFVAVTG